MPDLRIDVKSTADTRGLSTSRREVDRFGRSTTDLGNRSDRSSRKVSRFGGSLGVVAKGFAAGAIGTGAALAGRAVIRFGFDSVRAASDTEQAFGAVDSVFKRNADTVKRWAAGAVDDVGLAKSEFAQMAAVLGASLKNSGIENYTAKTRTLIRTGADLAATFGGTTKQAVEAIGSLMRGELDPIEQYGVNLKQVDINARLAANGQDKLTGAAAKQAEMQARLDLLFLKTKDSVGAYRRESTTLAGQQQRLRANFENLKSTLGQRLTPALTNTLEAVNKLFGGQDKLRGSGTKLARSNRSALSPSFVELRKASSRAGDAFRKSGGDMEGLGRAARAYNKVILTAARVTGVTTSHAFRVMSVSAGIAASGISRISNALAAVVGWADRAINRLEILRGKQAGVAAFKAGSSFLPRSADRGLARAQGFGSSTGYGRSRLNVNLTSSPQVTIAVDSPALSKIFRVIVKDELRQLSRAGEAVV